jgi:uncharacterized protein YprB with RNaseH-like and TPR domain
MKNDQSSIGTKKISLRRMGKYAKLALMCPADPNLLARQLALLKQVEGRGVSRASEHFAGRLDGVSTGAAAGRTGPADSPPPDAPFDRLFPDAERFESPAGGACRLVRSSAALNGQHTRQGYRCPVEIFGGPPEPAALADLTDNPDWARVDPARIVYLDTETTGLSTGTGTYTFLIGLGRFADGAFVVEQFFMEDYACEGALVEAVDRALEGAEGLVSYNGRTFDVPLMEVRWRMQRRRPRFPALHLDLLHYARRLWRLRLPNCSLGTVEGQILGIRRLSDVDGSWVPRIYFDYIHGLRPERLVPVFDHHAQDIFSLGALAAALLAAWRNPDDARFAHASDQWGLARLCETLGRREAAVARREAAVLAARDEDLGFRMAMHLARIYRRVGRLEEAVAIWEARAAQARRDRLDPLVELAKHAEHTLKDYAAAGRWAQRALELVMARAELDSLRGLEDGRAGGAMRTWTAGGAGAAALAEQLQRRLTRLETRRTKAVAKRPVRERKQNRKSAKDANEL